MRAHDEWRRHGSGKWDYTTNAEKLKAFWKAGMQRATNVTLLIRTIPHIGREGSGITTFPVTAITKPLFTTTSPRVEYTIWVTDTGIVKLFAYFSPTLNLFNEEEGLQYAVSIDDEKPQLLSLNKEDKNSISGVWNSWVANNIIVKTSQHRISKPGLHVVKYWAVSPAVILQKLGLDCGGLKPSYLGPPETNNVVLHEP
jgi:hypothetical protein